MSAPTPYPVAARSLLRDTLFDAARELLKSRPWGQITMAHVAAAAGVSRQTMYNEFGSRDAFAQELVLREADLFLTSVEQAIAANPEDPAAALAAAFDVFLSAAAEDPLVRAIVSGGGEDSLLPLVTTQGQPVLEHATERLSASIVATWPQVSRADAHLLAETVVRLGISHAALPSGPAQMTAASVARLLAPYIEQLMTGTSGDGMAA